MGKIASQYSYQNKKLIIAVTIGYLGIFWIKLRWYTWPAKVVVMVVMMMMSLLLRSPPRIPDYGFAVSCSVYVQCRHHFAVKVVVSQALQKGEIKVHKRIYPYRDSG